MTTSQDGAGWLQFFPGLNARGLTGVKLITADAHAGVGRRDRGDAARRVLAALPDALRGEP